MEIPISRVIFTIFTRALWNFNFKIQVRDRTWPPKPTATLIKRTPCAIKISQSLKLHRYKPITIRLPLIGDNFAFQKTCAPPTNTFCTWSRPQNAACHDRVWSTCRKSISCPEKHSARTAPSCIAAGTTLDAARGRAKSAAPRVKKLFIYPSTYM